MQLPIPLIKLSGPLRHLLCVIGLVWSRTRTHSCRVLYLTVWCLTFGSQLFAAEVRVASMPDLQTAILKAASGDRIIIANSVYEIESPINIATSGAKLQPIEIQPKR